MTIMHLTGTKSYHPTRPRKHGLTTTARGALFATLTAGMLAACTPTKDVRGNFVDSEVLATVETGKHTRDNIREMLGSPSSIAMFEKETWFYIGKNTETRAFFKPETKNRQVVVVSFSTDGTVSEIKKLGLKDGKQVAIVDRTTPTKGKELTMFEQFIGNLGRFNTDAGEEQ